MKPRNTLVWSIAAMIVCSVGVGCGPERTIPPTSRLVRAPRPCGHAPRPDRWTHTRIRCAVRRNLAEQDMLPDRLDDETRPNFTPGNPNQLALRVIDTETAEIVASVVVTGQDHRNGRSMGGPWLVRFAVKGLRDAAARIKPE